MKLSLQTQLFPNAEEAAKLKATLERFNEAATWLAGIAFERKVSNSFVLHRLCYKELRERFGLPSNIAIRCIAQVCEAYKRDKDKRPRFRKHAGIPFSMGRTIRFTGPDRVSISTLEGRVIVPFIMGKYQAERFGWSKGQCDLVLRKDGKWFLLVTVDVPEATPIPTTDFIGVDPGVINIAGDSDGEFHTKPEIEAKRIQYGRRRKVLGEATRDAKRSKRAGCHKAAARSRSKEARFRKDINHKISKQLVAKAQGTGRGIALEDTKGIHDRITVRKPQRARFKAWAFDQLRSFIEYKAGLAGVEFQLIPAFYSSQTCNACGHCEHANRKSQADFECKACGQKAHADINSARNLRDRARGACQTSHRRGKGRATDARLMPSTAPSRLL